MRAVAILMVVGVHSMGYCQELSGIAKELIALIVHTISVPVFFLVDGYLFAKKNIIYEKLNYLKYIKKSGFRLLLPWFIFVVGYSSLRYIFELSGFLKERLILDQPIKEVLINSYGSVVTPQLYFLLSLFIIRLAAPLTKRLLLKDKKVTFFVSFLIIAIYYNTNGFISPYLTIPNGQEPILHAFWGIQYYLLGINIFLFKDSLNSQVSFVACFSFFCILYMVDRNFVTFSFMGRLIQFSYLLSFYFAFKIISFDSLLIGSIGKNTMGIFLLHCPPLLKTTSLIINNFIKQPLMSYISITFVTFFAGYVLTIAINKTSYGPIFFGIPFQKKSDRQFD